MKRHAALVLLLAGLTACGGGSSLPGAPSASQGSTVASPGRLTFVSGETQSPVASATIVIDGRRYTTDAEGQIILDAAHDRGSVLDVQASGFLERRTLLSSDRFTLWPSRSPTGLDEDQTARMVYTCASGCEAMLRVLSDNVIVVPSAELATDPLAMESHRVAAERLSSATGGAVSLSIVPPGTAFGVYATTSVDPTDPAIVSMGAGAVTRRRLGWQGEIVEAAIVFRSVALARRSALVMHELGHVFGLGHSPRVGDVMWNGPELYNATDFSPRERLAVGLMLQRRPGNRFPDSDGVITTAAASSLSTTLACGQH